MAETESPEGEQGPAGDQTLTWKSPSPGELDLSGVAPHAEAGHEEPRVASQWDVIRQHLEARYTAEDIDGQLWIQISYPTRRSQMVAVDFFEALEHPFVSVRTRVCREKKLAPRLALDQNSKLPIGHMALEDGYYVLMHTFLSERLDLEKLELALNLLARTADRIESLFEGEDRF